MSSEDPSSSRPPRTLLVYTKKPIEEVRIFDLRGSDIISIREPIEDGTPVSPEEWGFTDPSEDGVCKYCQFMMHPSAPNLIWHQPNVQTLVDSECRFCSWVEVSISKGSDLATSRYRQGDPAFCDPDSTSSRIVLSLSRFPKHTRVVPTVGPRTDFGEMNGVPLNISTLSQLGELASRRFWVRMTEINDPSPHDRLKMLKTWVEECSHHETCSRLPGTRGTRLPTRVLDLSGSPDIASDSDDIKIRLRETSEGEVGRYTTLSYCWGSDPEHHFKTTRGTLGEYAGGIDFFTLPLTQREAILATLYLGIRYIWIDSICIIQDDPHDWEVEAAKMSSVYSNSFLTLAATSSSSPEGGLLNPFQAAVHAPVHGDTVMLRMETHGTIDKATEPLNTRGWTLQEAVLSPRSVCFGGEQWLWKCPGRYATEDGLVDRTEPMPGNIAQWAMIEAQGPGDDGRNYLKHWYRLVSNYSGRSLSYREDKLKAIAGLADAFTRRTGYQYAAGVWAEDLAGGLSWQTTSHGVDRYPGNIPSWSWASVDGEVMFNDIRSVLIPMITLLNMEQEWEGLPLSSNLKACRLTVSGKLLQAAIGPQSLTQKFRYHLLAGPGSKEILGELFLDDLVPIQQEASTIWCLLVYTAPASNDDPQHFMLALVPASGEGGDTGTSMYRRIGTGIVWDKIRFEDADHKRGVGREALSEASSETVVLV